MQSLNRGIEFSNSFQINNYSGNEKFQTGVSKRKLQAVYPEENMREPYSKKIIVANEGFNGVEERVRKAVFKLALEEKKEEEDSIAINKGLEVAAVEFPPGFDPLDYLGQCYPEYRDNPQKTLETIKQDGLRTLIANINNLNFPARLALCNQLAEEDPIWMQTPLAENFKNFGFIDEILMFDIEGRLTLCDQIAEQGDWAVTALSWNFDQLGLINQKQPHELAAHGEWAAAGLLDNISRLGINKATLEYRHSLARVIAVQGGEASSKLVEKFDMFKLDELEAPDFLSLIREISGKCQYASRAFISSFDKLNLNERIQQFADATARLAFFKELTVINVGLAEAIAKRWENMGFENLDVDSRLALCRLIATQGTGAAKQLVINLKKLGLDGANTSGMMALWREVLAIDRNGIIADHLVWKLDRLGIEKAMLSERIDLYEKISSRHQDRTFKMVYELDRLNLDPSEMRRVIFALIPYFILIPHYHNPEISTMKSGHYLGYLKGIGPVTSILSNEEGRFTKDELLKFEDFLRSDYKFKALHFIYQNTSKKREELNNLIYWIAYTAGALYDLEGSETDLTAINKQLERISEDPYPLQRFCSVAELLRKIHI